MSRAALVLAALVAATSAAHADATVTGFDHGKKIKLDVTRVDGQLVGVKTARAYRQMAKAAKKSGVDLGIRSGYRSLAQQQALYDRWLAGKGNSAAPPGMSNHENGSALDIKLTDKDAYAWLEKHASTYGFHRTVPGEPWHWEYTGQKSAPKSAAKTAKTEKKRSSKKAVAKVPSYSAF